MGMAVTLVRAGVFGLAACLLPHEGFAGAQPSDAHSEQPNGGLVTGLKTPLARTGRLSRQDASSLVLGGRIAPGETIRTGHDGYVELVWGRRIFVAVREASEVMIEEVQDGHATVHLKEGGVRVAHAYRAGQPTDVVTIIAPTSRVATRGGIVEVDVSPRSSQLTLFTRLKEAFARMLDERHGPELIRILEGQARIEPSASPSGSQLLDAPLQVLVLSGSIADVTEVPARDAGPRLSADQRGITPGLIRERIIAAHREQAVREEEAIHKATAAEEMPAATQVDVRGTVLSTSFGLRPGIATSGSMAAAQPAPMPIPALVPTQSGGINSETLLRDILRAGRDR